MAVQRQASCYDTDGGVDGGANLAVARVAAPNERERSIVAQTITKAAVCKLLAPALQRGLTTRICNEQWDGSY